MTPGSLYETLSKYAVSKGQELNRDREFVLEILSGLLRNEERYGYRSCPCRLASGVREHDRDIICPCVYKDPDINEYGSCFCQLYVSKDWNEGSTEHRVVPERRPPERQV
ncbi:MAG TPA: ferredoxin-thioredoxin reductase catalytic domain-containing protein [Dissulfurispiraceae bacterium]|nr:ferredoxin-thioredoxin reductase catalytic domain-containing protein [Dissulfurispiraceae bacterium]